MQSVSSAEKPKEKSEHPCLYLRNSSSDSRWLLQSKLVGLCYYCSSLRTENLCRAIVLLYLYISRFLVEISFHLTLRGINREQKEAVQQLFGMLK